MKHRYQHITAVNKLHNESSATWFCLVELVRAWGMSCLLCHKKKIKSFKFSETALRLRYRPLVFALITVTAFLALVSPSQAAITKVKDVGNNNSTTTGTTLAVTVPAGGGSSAWTTLATANAMAPRKRIHVVTVLERMS